MPHRLTRFLSLVAAIILSPTFLPAQTPAQVKKTMELLPQSTNAVAVIRFDALLKTPQAKTEGWSSHPERLGIETIPSWVSWGIIGKEVDPVRGQLWEIAMAPLPAPLTIDDIAKQQELTVQNMDGVPVARGIKRDAYYIQLSNDDSKILASVTPAAYRFVSQWMAALKYRNGEPPVLSTVLTTAAAKTAHVIMAIDLRNVFDPYQVESWVKKTWPETQTTQVPARVSGFLAEVQGVSLSVISSSSLQATLSIHSANDIELGADWISKVLQEILVERDLEIDEVASLTFQIDGKTANASFELQPYSLRQLMSLWLSPHPSAPSVSPDSSIADLATSTTSSTITPKPTTTSRPSNSANSSRSLGIEKNQDPVYKANQTYWNSVNQMLEDLSRGSRRSTNYLQAATYFDRYAQKMIDLPAENVKDDLLEYGAHMASDVRAIASSLRGMYIDVNTDEQTITYQTNYNPGWASANPWGMVGGQMPYTNVTSNVAEVREKQADTIKKAAADREKIWNMMDKEHAQMKIKLTQEFGAEFVEGN